MTEETEETSQKAMFRLVRQGAGLEALDLFEVPSPKTGTVLTRCGLLVSLYFPGGATIEKREAAIRVMRSYWNAFHEHLTHWLPLTGKKLKTISNDELPPIHQPERLADLSEWYDFTFFGYRKEQDTKGVASFMASIACIPERDKEENSFFEAHIPLSWAIENGYGAVCELVRQWASELNAAHGTCGIGLLFEVGGAKYLEYSYFLLKRHPCLDYERQGRFSSQVNSFRTGGVKPYKIRTNNWLTILGDPIVKELGGKAHIEKELGPDCPIFDYKGGILIQATPEPELGSTEENYIPEGYRKVARLTKPVRFEAYSGSLFENLPDPLDNRDETLTWLRRFD